ncbi:MAG: SET domain-containing protein-lysine N-methyltransferase [Candidatus Komeilibacteria bacterium]
MIIPTNKIYIGKSSVGGRGVFAAVDIKKDELIETAPYIVIGDNDASGELLHYEFGHEEGKNLFCLGYGSMYNHSKKANIEYRYSSNKLKDCLDFVALRDIKKDEELFISYGDEWWNTRSKKEL